MLVKNLKGLKYPDEFVVRFFFKENLQNKLGKVLELGSGNGNNLTLFYQYSWDVIGVDISQAAIEDANENFRTLNKSNDLESEYTFVFDDMLNFVKTTPTKGYDVLLLPSSIYYMKPAQIVELFEIINSRQLLTSNALVFLKIRDILDYRAGKGTLLEHNSYQLTIDETGEKGVVMTFYSISDFIKLLENTLSIFNPKIMKLNFENYQGEYVVDNYEWVIWGNVNVSK